MCVYACSYSYVYIYICMYLYIHIHTFHIRYNPKLETVHPSRFYFLCVQRRKKRLRVLEWLCQATPSTSAYWASGIQTLSSHPRKWAAHSLPRCPLYWLPSLVCSVESWNKEAKHDLIQPEMRTCIITSLQLKLFTTLYVSTKAMQILILKLRVDFNK